MEGSPIVMGAAASLAAGLATAIGALPVLLVRNVSQALHDTLLGFAAGVMLAASFFSLLIPGLHLAQSDLGSRPLAAGIIALSMLLGAAALAWTNRAVPHEHFLLGRAGPASLALRRTWLFVLAITLHNVPEGLAVGIGFGSGDAARAATLALGIGLQNIPEGLAVAVALAALKYRPLFAFAVGGATGLVEPVAGLLGAALVTVFAPLLPWALGFAAGAMIFVISNEIVPETHRHGHEGMATVGLMLGIALMMFLDVVFS